MTLDELNRIDVNDPNQVKALQNFLKSRGYYSKGIDGKWGGDTIEAVKSLRGDLQTESGNRRVEAESRAAENSPAAEATRAATKFGPYVAGAGIGYGISRGINKRFDAKDLEQKGVVSRLATDKAVNPIIAEQSLKGENRKRLMRTGSQFLAPAALAGISELTRRYVAPQFPDEKTREYVNLSATAEQAAGGTLAVKQLIDLSTRSSPNDPVDEARIRSRAAEARGDPYTVSAKAKAATPVPDAPDPARMAELRAKRVTELRTEAKAMGLRTSGLKDDIARRIAEAPPSTATAKPKRLPKGKAGLLAPFAAGAIAYDAASSDAEAAGDTPMEAGGKGALAGFGAAGMTAAVPYALSKLPASVGRAVATGGPALAGGTVEAMTDYSPTEQLQGRVALGSYLPEWAQSAPIREAHEMAQVPERNPARPRAGMFEESKGDDFDAMLADFVRAVEEHNSGVGNYGP